LPAPVEEEAVKPLSEADKAVAKRREKIAEELRTDAEIVLSGMRLMNRPRDNAKTRFIDTFFDSNAASRFPVVEDDIKEENLVEWAFVEPLPSMRDVMASEVEAAFRTAGVQVPATSKVMATKILSSDTDSKLGILADVPLAKLEVNLVLAHIAALGYRWPPRVAVAVARRATIVILNRSKFEGRANA